MFAPCSVEPFINYGERAGVVCAASRGERREGMGYVDREARAASEASIELASFPVATALKPAALVRHAQTFRRAHDITGYRHVQDVPKLLIFFADLFRRTQKLNGSNRKTNYKIHTWNVSIFLH